MMPTRVQFFNFVIFLFVWQNRQPIFIKGDIFAALSQLEDLVSFEQRLGKVLEEYLVLEERRFDEMNNFAMIVRKATERMKLEGMDILNSPGNSYSVIKRFVFGWIHLNRLLYQDLAKDLRNQVKLSMIRFPTYTDDLIGAMEALLRLQDAYNLTARTIVEERIPGCLSAPAALTADDCFEIGVKAFSSGRYGQSRDWLNEALRLFRNGYHDDTVVMTEVLEQLAQTEYIKGNIKRAINLTKELLDLAPNHIRARHDLRFYAQQRGKNLEHSYEHVIARQAEVNATESSKGRYASLCRGELPKNQPTDERTLTCWYHGTKLPALMLKPIKVEVLIHSPLVYVFRGIISDSEADKLKNLARPKLSRAKVFDQITGVEQDVDFRVSKSAWLANEDHEVIRRLNRRFESATGLDVSTAEQLQVANYGIGGQYEPHVDFGGPGSPLDTSETGNRIATLLIYLNDVESGGYTVFVQKGIYLKPKKGDAAFWYNLNRSGDANYDTRHAGCPVLCGNKWVANKWFRERGQEFRRRCALESNL